MGGFDLFVELHREGSAIIDEATTFISRQFIVCYGNFGTEYLFLHSEMFK